MDLRAFEQFWDGKSSENLKQSNMICFLSEQDHRGCWVGRQEILSWSHYRDPETAEVTGLQWELGGGEK